MIDRVELLAAARALGPTAEWTLRRILAEVDRRQREMPVAAE